jgi:hypothetical protein
MAQWPKSKAYKQRYFVPDLSPEQRVELKSAHFKVIFVAESPFLSEVAPEKDKERRPLCGKAGQDWWSMIGQLVEHGRASGEASQPSKDTSLPRLLELCERAGIAVLNSVQYPLDPKIIEYYDQGADPVASLGFSKIGLTHYKKLKTSDEVEAAIHELRRRLVHSSIVGLPVVSLGNDAQWFVSRALEAKPGEGRHLETVPHPSAWWRAGGKFREKARGQLKALLSQGALERPLRGHVSREVNPK